LYGKCTLIIVVIVVVIIAHQSRARYCPCVCLLLVFCSSNWFVINNLILHGSLGTLVCPQQTSWWNSIGIIHMEAPNMDVVGKIGNLAVSQKW